MVGKYRGCIFGRTRKRVSQMMPRLYLAGKIGKDDWRHDLVPGLRNHLWGDGPILTPIFSYVGPFFVSCDHGCSHVPNGHGAVSDGGCESGFKQSDVIRHNMAALAAADLVFAYITATSCYGTLIEIGWALRDGKRVVIAFAPRVPKDDFWYAAMQADAVHTDVSPRRMKCILSDELQKTKPRAGTRGQYTREQQHEYYQT